MKNSPGQALKIKKNNFNCYFHNLTVVFIALWFMLWMGYFSDQDAQ